MITGPGGPVIIARGEGIRASWACRHTSKAEEYAPAGKAQMSVVFAGREAGLLIEESDDALIEESSTACSKLFGSTGLSVEVARVDRHRDGRPVVSPGHAARVRSLLQQGTGMLNMALAGDWTTSPTIEGAVASGLHAAGLALAHADH
jgi:protoporphyrinogen oxidase